MDAAQLLEAAEAAYDAYYLELEGHAASGVRLKVWAGLPQAEKDAWVAGVVAVEAYINALA